MSQSPSSLVVTISLATSLKNENILSICRLSIIPLHSSNVVFPTTFLTVDMILFQMIPPE
jgi:hypothetical protein